MNSLTLRHKAEEENNDMAAVNRICVRQTQSADKQSEWP